MRFRQRSDGEVIASAIRMAERKQAEGCSLCAEAYRGLARRTLLKAGGLAAGALAASMADVSAIAAPGRAKANAEAVDAHALAARLDRTAQVQVARSLVGQTTPTGAFRGTKAPWSLLIEESATGHILSVLEAGSEVHVGAIIGDTAYVVQGNWNVVSPLATARWRELRQHGASTAATLGGFVQPVPAEAACAMCPGLLGACTLAVAACAADCPPCCTAAVAICGFAFNCCFNQ